MYCTAGVIPALEAITPEISLCMSHSLTVTTVLNNCHDRHVLKGRNIQKKQKAVMLLTVTIELEYLYRAGVVFKSNFFCNI